MPGEHKRRLQASVEVVLRADPKQRTKLRVLMIADFTETP